LVIIVLGLFTLGHKQNAQSSKAFHLDQLMNIMDTLSATQIDDYMIKNEFKLEKKTPVYKFDSHTLKISTITDSYKINYFRKNEDITIHFYKDKPYQITCHTNEKSQSSQVETECKLKGYRILPKNNPNLKYLTYGKGKYSLEFHWTGLALDVVMTNLFYDPSLEGK